MQPTEKYPFIFSDERKYRIRRHLAFWTFWWITQGVLYSVIGYSGEPGYPVRLANSITESLFYMVAHIGLAYALMYFVIPRYLLKQKYWLTAIWVLICFLGAAVISTILSATIIPEIEEYFLHNPASQNSLRLRATARIHLSLMAGLRGGITIGGIAASIKLMKHWYVKEQRNLQLQKENVEAQLQLLKAQVHPHFLFNTLNNIYSHTQNTAPVASQLVMGLSDMLRFMLYECNQPQVPLSKELKMIQDYISLEQIRYDDQLDVHVDLPASTDNLSIAPLLLLPLVENCFKHGTSHMIEQPWLNMQVTLENNNMYVKLMNGKVNEVAKSSHTGIGILNVRKRLSFLYPGKHELLITDEEEVFVVNLRIQLEKMPLTKKESGAFKLTYHE
ncbi:MULTISPECIES: sensor histidine kinase [Niastella]|uniref:Histidine kinase n=1 Tax=Niastella soli TaxID=2821487 RepID=A0ABS3YP56_9BACT|nr:histidine kinase [Niastella soli]MBO9199668.1 histidine kinase [Niastella soli]